MGDMTSLALYRFRQLQAAQAAPVPVIDSAEEATGVPISGPMVLEGVTTGDGRRIEHGALRFPENPISILWDREEGDHTGSVVGTITRMERRDNGEIWGYGTLSITNDPEAAADVQRAMELVRDNAIGWSVALDEVTAHLETTATRGDDDDEWSYDDEVMVTTDARIRHIALVDTAAFEAARPVIASPRAAYPAKHFEKWTSRDYVPFTVEADGRVWGHAAGGGCHRGTAGCLTYDSDVDPDMRGFHTGAPITLDNGETLRVGPVTFGGLHADVNMTRAQVRLHHENGSTVVALVRAWDDGRGRLAVAGTLVDGLDTGTVDQMRGCAPSYERWPEGSGLTLVGLHLVPLPAHPVAASAVEAGGGMVGVDCGCDDRCEVHG
jgi:hypothetical protein